VTILWFACSQGIGVMETRHVSEKIPLSEVPFIMRAMGYFPTEQEVNKLNIGLLLFTGWAKLNGPTFILV